MFPPERGQMLQQAFINRMAMIYDCLDRPVEVNGVPQDDGCCHEIEATGPVALILETAVAHLAQSVEEHGSGERIAGFPLVEPGMDTAAQFDVLQPVESEQRALHSAYLSERHCQSVLTRVTAQFSQHQRRRHRSLPD